MISTAEDIETGKFPQTASDSIPRHPLRDLTDTFSTPVEAVAYAIAYLSAHVRRKASASQRSRSEMRCYLPYRLHPTALNGVQIVVNRNYKPVGSNRLHRDWVVYEDQPFALVELDAAQLRSVAHPHHVVTGGFYADVSAPWCSRSNAEAYLQRLKTLQAILQRSGWRRAA